MDVGDGVEYAGQDQCMDVDIREPERNLLAVGE